ncbi:MAG: hypothetical protein V7L11_01725 [Nostoc sp.]|uniref:hypothetical protein n=1 Tax=Nostoc sp. TaxID=1180 RepID=UPI002FF97496
MSTGQLKCDKKGIMYYEGYFSDINNFLNPKIKVHCYCCGGAVPNWCLEKDETEWYCPWCGDIGDSSFWTAPATQSPTPKPTK